MGSREKDHGNDNKPKPRLFTVTAIKELFRDVKKALTAKAPAPQPRRKRTEETRGGFHRLAMSVKHWIRSPRTMPLQAEGFSDALDWLQLWNQEPAAEPDPGYEPARPDSFEPSDDFSHEI